MLKLGSKAQEKFTGFTGTVMARAEYLYGCVRYSILPDTLKEGVPQDWLWFDEPQLESCEILQDKDEQETKPVHGPRPNAPQR